MKEIASINNEYIKYLAALKDKKNRNKEEKYFSILKLKKVPYLVPFCV